MQFCPTCDNKLHMEIGQLNAVPSSPKDFSTPLTLYCKHCSYKRVVDQSASNKDASDTFDPCMYRSNYSSNHPLYYSTVVNQYTFDDPTLPCLSEGACINDKCVSRTDSTVDPEILYVRYNDQDLRFLYLCRHCRKCWHFTDVNGSQTHEVLFDFSNPKIDDAVKQ